MSTQNNYVLKNRQNTSTISNSSFNVPVYTAASKKINVPMVSEEAVGTNSDVATFSRGSEVKNLDNLVESVQNTLKKHNCYLGRDEILNILINILKEATGEDIKDLTDLEIINQYTLLLTQTIEQMVVEKKELNADNIKKEAKEYQGLIRSGYDSVKEFIENNSGKSLDDMLDTPAFKKYKFIKKGLFKKLTREEKIELYFNYLEKAINEMHEKGDDENKISTWIKTTIMSLIHNSPDEDKAAIIEFAKGQRAKNIHRTIIDAINSYENQVLQTQVANNTSTEQIINIAINSSDNLNEQANAVNELQEYITSKQNDEGINNTQKGINNYTIYYEENAEKIKTINEKIKNNQALTDEENEIWNRIKLQNAQMVGHGQGLLINQVASDNVLKTAFTGTVNCLQQAPNNEEVLAGLNQYAQDNQENLRFNAEETNELFNNAGLESPIQTQNSSNQTTTQVQNTTSTTQTQNQTQIGFTQKEQVSTKAENKVTTQEIVEIGYSNSNTVETNNTPREKVNNNSAQVIETSENTETTTETFIRPNATIFEIIQQGTEAVKKYFCQNKVKATYDVLNNADKIKDNALLAKAYETFETSLTGKEQTMILTRNISGNVLSELISRTDKNALVKYSDERKASSFYANQLISNAVEEIQEENPRYKKQQRMNEYTC